jgi:hypothetical protein
MILLTQYCAGDKVETEISRACSMYGERRGMYRLLVGKHEGKRLMRRPGIDGRITLRWIFQK